MFSVVSFVDVFHTSEIAEKAHLGQYDTHLKDSAKKKSEYKEQSVIKETSCVSLGMTSLLYVILL